MRGGGSEREGEGGRGEGGGGSDKSRTGHVSTFFKYICLRN